MDKELISCKNKDLIHYDIIDNIGMLVAGSCQANPKSNEFFGFIGATLMFDADALGKKYTLNIHSVNQLPKPAYSVFNGKTSICYLAQDSSSPSLQELLLNDADIVFDNAILVHPTLKTNPLITADFFEANKYVEKTITSVSLHYSNILKGLEQETGTPVTKEHIFFRPSYVSGLIKGTFSYQFLDKVACFRSNEIITAALDDCFSKKQPS